MTTTRFEYGTARIRDLQAVDCPRPAGKRAVGRTALDGYGRPSVYLSLLRLVCSNGAVGYSPAFRSELSVGRGDDGVAFALTRVLDGFNNEDGYAALRQRFESAAKSWASVNEAQKLYKLLARLHGRGE